MAARLQTLQIHAFPSEVEDSTLYNPKPGTGTTGFIDIPSKNYSFYSGEEKYRPVMQQDGGQLSEWNRMYEPSPDQAERDRKAAFMAGTPHGVQKIQMQESNATKITLTCVVENDIGSNTDSKIDRCFEVTVSPAIRAIDLQRLISDRAGVAPGLQRLSYAGKDFNDAQRTLQHYGVAYWHSKFPHWPIKIR